MWNEFSFDQIQSVEFCISADRDGEHEHYLIPTDRRVQEALRSMLSSTAHQLLTAGEDTPEWDHFTLAEKYAPKEALVADLASEEMATIRSLYQEEAWHSNPAALQTPANVSYYFGVFRDRRRRKLLAVRQAAQFKGVIRSHGRLIKLLNDSLTIVDDKMFRLDNEFDFLVTREHVYILHPVGFERVAEIEQQVAASAREKAIALGAQVRFADFTRIADFVAQHRRAARLVADLTSRGGLSEIKRSKFILAAAETDVVLETIRQKVGPSAGSELAFLELLDDRRYTTAIKTGPKEAYVAGSRKPLRRPPAH